MDVAPDNLPADIAREAGSLISTLRTAGWTLLEARYDAKTLGNWHIDLARDDLSLRLVKDRSQFFVDGPPVQELKATGLWRAFEDFAEFQRVIVNWVIGSPRV
jgi:hypothetical protein